MNNRTKDIAVTLSFAAFIAFFVVMCAIRFFHPVSVSESERRPLAGPPQNVTWESIIDKSSIDKFEDFTVDQFPFREFFRSVKAHISRDILRLRENNSLAIEDEYIVKIESDFSAELVSYSLGRLAYIDEKYLSQSGDKFVSVVPDKNYFLGRDYGYPSPNYEGLVDDVKAALHDMTYVDIFGALSLEDYYRTDTHWRQENLHDVVVSLSDAMGVGERISHEYTENVLEGFKGVYHGQSALSPEPDRLVYLTNDALDACTVYDYETDKMSGLYAPELFYGEDGYNLFLHGTRALLRIDNPSAETEDELIVFRDSFGSSLIPLLAEGYKSIYVVDIRYVMPDMLEQLIDFEGKDVLFIYSALILNQKAFK